MAYSAYDNYRPPSLAHQYSGYPYADTPRGAYADDLAVSTRYPYGEPVRGDFDQPYPGSAYGEPGYQMYSNSQAVAPYYGGGQYGGGYDDLALERQYHPDRELDYPIGGSALSRSRSRRSSSVSFHRQLSMGPPTSSFFDSYRNRNSPLIKFRMKGSFRSGISLSDAVAGARLSGGDYLKWHEMSPDARGRVYLKVRWNGYNSLTYEIPVDSYEGRVRLSTLARRVARACVHFIQANAIPVSWDRVKLYYLEEITPGTWQPALTIQ